MIQGYWLSLFWVVLLSGCHMASPAKVPGSSQYVLSMDTSVVKQSPTKRHRSVETLLVSVPVANPGYQTSAMKYLTVPYKLRAYANNSWVSPPANMTLPIFVQSMTALSYFHAVVGAPFVGSTRYRLDTVIECFQQEFLQPQRVERVAILATLVDTRTHQIIATKRFEEVVPAPGNDPYGGVLAANRAVTLIAYQMSDFVVRALR